MGKIQESGQTTSEALCSYNAAGFASFAHWLPLLAVLASEASMCRRSIRRDSVPDTVCRPLPGDSPQVSHAITRDQTMQNLPSVRERHHEIGPAIVQITVRLSECIRYRGVHQNIPPVSTGRT